MKLTKILIASLLFPTLAFAAEGPIEIPLWANGAPGSEGVQEKEVYEPATADRNYSMLYNVHNPAIVAYLPSKETATGAAVIIAPGGAHRFLAIDHEGYDVAKWLNTIGVAGFVLKYRLARTEGYDYTVDTSVQDAHRAIRLIRDRAKEWNLDPNRIGILGFSAGGAVAAYASARYDAGNPEASDPLDRLSSRPDFQALIYPGLRADSLEVPSNAPPAFLLCAFDDERPAQTVAELYLKFKQADVPTELHVYARGGHGFGMRERSIPIGQWHVRFAEWMGDSGLLKKE